MRVEIINTGTELLLGRVTNTHLAFLAQSLLGLGLRVDRQVTVPDGESILEALDEARHRAELVIVTGGLGPTSDDITRDAAAAAFGLELIFHPEILDDIAIKFAKRNIAMNDLQRSQAMVPAGGVVLNNPNGTAPGLIIPGEKNIAVLLPGPPGELRPMWTNEAVPWLRKKFADQLPPVHEVALRTLGLGETRVQLLVEAEVKALGPIEVGYCARPGGEVDLRLIGQDRNLVDQAGQIARAKLRDAIYAEGTEAMEEVVVRLARAAGKTIATAESCTGGLVAHRITNIAGSSEIFRYGWVTYSNEAKMTELGVHAALLEKHDAVSAEVAQAMAEGALRTGASDLAIALTGLAGPTGGTPEKPVGLVYIALAARDAKPVVVERTITANREMFKYVASQIALDLLRRALV